MTGIDFIRASRLHRICCAALIAAMALIWVDGSRATCFAQDNAGPANVDTAALPAAESVEPARSASPAKDNSFLGWMIRTSGIFGFLIMIAAFVMIALLMTLALQLRRDNYIPSGLVEQFEQRLQTRDYQGAYEIARGSESFLGRVLTAGLGRLSPSRSYDEAEAAMQEVGDDEALAMEQKIGYLALIASVAPMLGLLGTVQGMVASFQALAISNTTPSSSSLADGIATALFTTLEGLVVCIPAIVFHMIYKNRLARFLMESGHVATHLMKSFQLVGKSPAKLFGGAAPAGVPAAPEK